MKTLIAVSLLALTGCITQRSISFGQMAAPVGSSGGDVAVSTGIMYQEQRAPATNGTDSAGNPTSSQVVSKGLAIPWFEANGQYGLSRQVALNVHASPAGVQPGIKWTLNRSAIAHIALLPEVGFGYGQHNSSTFIAGADGAQEENSPTSTTSLIFQAGLKILISHNSGFYGGLGYDFMYTRSLEVDRPGPPNTQIETRTLTASMQHQLAFAVGFSAKVGMLSIRPEIAVAIVPAINGTLDKTVGGMPDPQVSAGGGFAWAILPSFAFALTTPPTEKVEVEERPTTDPDAREGKDEDDDEENARRRKRQQEDE